MPVSVPLLPPARNSARLRPTMTELEFRSEVPPYRDIAVVVDGRWWRRRPELPTTHERLPRGFEVTAPTVFNNVALVMGSRRLEPDSTNRVLGASGFAFAGSGVLSTAASFAKHLRAHGTLPNSGQYFLVLANEAGTELTLAADSFGTHPVYVYASHRRYIVSNRFHMLLVLAKSLGWPLTLSDSAFLTRLYPISFGQQLMTPKVYFKEVELLGADSLPVIRKGRLFIEPRPTQKYSSYEHALEQGASDIADLMTALRGQKNVFYRLSGGWDSRSYYAHMLRTRLHRSSYCWTFPTLEKDFRVVRQLLGRYGGAFSDSPVWLNSVIPVSLDEAFSLYRSRTLGLYATNLGLEAFQREGLDTDTSFVMFGGGGECLRNFYFAHRQSLQPRDVRDEVAMSLSRVPPLNPHIAKLAREISRGLLSGPGADCHAQLRHHYRNFRNRFHFGIATQSVANRLNVQPLMQPALLCAADLAGPEAVARGQLHFDLQTMVDDELPLVPFDDAAKAFVPAVIEASQFRGRTPSIAPISKSGRLADYVRVPLGGPAPPALFSGGDKDRAWTELFRRAFDMVSRDSPLAPYCGPDLFTHITGLQGTKKAHYHQWSASFIGSADLLQLAGA